MENLDLTKILKNCPKGTELYSTICGIVEFGGIDDRSEDYPIDVYCHQTKDSYCFTADGRMYSEAMFGECLLFPSKDQRDWSKWQRPTIAKFKVGDSIKSKDNSIAQVTITDISDGWYHCKNACVSFGLPIDKQDDYELVVSGKFDPKTLQPFDKVLVRDRDENIWICDFFSYIDNDNLCISTGGNVNMYCIPYNDETKHLVGTTDEAPEYYRYWETDIKEECTDNKINGHEYVDLGLSVKWATCNVGASSPEDYGNYYAWGETTIKDRCSASNSVTYGLSFLQLQPQGYIDSEGNLTPSLDAATANWGSTWRLPTKAELTELKNNCTWTWTTQNGKTGYKVTGPNGNSIFLPAAGCRYGSSLVNAGEYGYYWSSTPHESDSISAYRLYFNSSNQNAYWIYRRYGHSVRPVTE